MHTTHSWWRALGWIALLLPIAALAFGCKGEFDEIDYPDGEGEFSILLRDAPVDKVSAVFVTIDSIEGFHNYYGWVELQTDPQTVDLLELQGGRVARLCRETVPAGSFIAFRLQVSSGQVQLRNGAFRPMSIQADADGYVQVDHGVQIIAERRTDVLIDWNVGTQLAEVPRWSLGSQLRVDEVSIHPLCTPVPFRDVNFEAAVRSLVGIPTGPIAHSDVEEIAELNLAGLGIVDLTGIECFSDLEVLDLAGNNVRDLQPLEGMQMLRDLRLGDNNVRRLDPLTTLPSLAALDLSGNDSIESLAPLAGRPGLRELRVRNAPIASNLIYVAAIPNLELLDLTGVPIGGLSLLQSLTSLRSLEIRNTGTTNLTALGGHPSLEELYARDNAISEAGPLLTIPNLQIVDVSQTSIGCPNAVLQALQAAGVSVTSDCP